MRLVFDKHKIVTRFGPAEPFSSVHFSCMRQWYAARMAVDYLSRMYSSGIFSQWAVAHKFYYVNSVGLVYDEFLNLTLRSSRYSELLLPNVYENPEPQKLTLDHFVIPFFILCSSCIFCTIWFVIELFIDFYNTLIMF